MSKVYARRIRAQLTAEMPLRQYFLFFGGTLLALLFVAHWLVPVSASNERIHSAPNFPPIRIHSDRKGPEAVVIDTSKSRIGPVLAAHEDMVAPETVTSEEASAREALARPEAPTLHCVDATELTKTKQDQTSRKVAEACKERRPIVTYHLHAVQHEPLSITYVDSRVRFSDTFAQLVPGSIGEASRGESKTRKTSDRLQPTLAGRSWFEEGGPATRRIPHRALCIFPHRAVCDSGYRRRADPRRAGRQITVGIACC